MEGAAGAHQQHPSQAILLDGVDTDLFWNAMRDHPFRLIGIHDVYLWPGSERFITAYPDRGDLNEFIAPAGPAARAIERGEMVVYDVRGPRLRNITSSFIARQDRSLEPSLPRRVDAAGTLFAPWLGPEWYPSDGALRWMPARATLRMGQLPPAKIRAGENSFEISFDMPERLLGRPEMAIAVEVSRTIRPAADPRDLGLGFGVFEVK